MAELACTVARQPRSRITRAAPNEFFKLKSAPALTSMAHRAAWPFMAAQCSALHGGEVARGGEGVSGGGDDGDGDGDDDGGDGDDDDDDDDEEENDDDDGDDDDNGDDNNDDNGDDDDDDANFDDDGDGAEDIVFDT